MRYTTRTWGTWTIAFAAVAALTLASSGAWAQQAKGASTSEKACMEVKGGGCVMTKDGTAISVGAASKAAPSQAKNDKDAKQEAAK